MKTNELRMDALRSAIRWYYKDATVEVDYVERVFKSEIGSHWEIRSHGSHLDLDGARNAMEELQGAINLVEAIESWELEVEPVERYEGMRAVYEAKCNEILNMLYDGDLMGIMVSMEV